MINAAPPVKLSRSLLELGICSGRLLQISPSYEVHEAFARFILSTDINLCDMTSYSRQVQNLLEKGFEDLRIWAQRILDKGEGFCAENDAQLLGHTDEHAKKHCGRTNTDLVFSQTENDYIHLFVGLPCPLAAPWGSVYSNDERLVFQPETLNVRQWYRSLGFETAELHAEPDDHIGLELEFICRALMQENEQTAKTIHEFIVAHPSRWVAQWNKLVQENAQTDFYRGLGNIAEALIESQCLHRVMENEGGKRASAA